MNRHGFHLGLLLLLVTMPVEAQSDSTAVASDTSHVAVAQEPQKPFDPSAPVTTVKVEFRPIQTLSGENDMYRSQHNPNMRLLDLTLRMQRPTGVYDEMRFELSGLRNPNTFDDIDVTLRKIRKYQLNLYHRRQKTFFSDEGGDLQGSGFDIETRETGGKLALSPLRNFAVNFGYARRESDGQLGSSYHSPWDEFPLTSIRNWLSDRYSGGMTLNTGNFMIGVDQSYRQLHVNENIVLRDGGSEGADGSDQAQLLSYGINKPRDGEFYKTNAKLQWHKGPIQILARYVAIRDEISLNALGSLSQTNPVGTLATESDTWKSSVKRFTDRGEVVARWKVARPAVLALRIETEQYAMDGTTRQKVSGLNFGIPVELDQVYKRSTAIGTNSVNASAEFGPFGPLTIDLGTSAFGRKVETKNTDADVVTSSTVEQGGISFNAGARLSWPWCKIEGKYQGGKIDNALTALTPLTGSKSEGSIHLIPKEGFDLYGKVVSRKRTNDHTLVGIGPVFDSNWLTMTMGASIDVKPFHLDFTHALFNTTTGAVVLDQADGAMVGRILTDDLNDASNSVNASVDLGFCRAEFKAFQSDVSGSYPYTTSRIEPKLFFQLPYGFGVGVGGFRYRFDNPTTNYDVSGAVVSIQINQ
ncbi:MAG: hypothetical protein V1495_07250 [Pseudomonadota bacterium]